VRRPSADAIKPWNHFYPSLTFEGKATLIVEPYAASLTVVESLTFSNSMQLSRDKNANLFRSGAKRFYKIARGLDYKTFYGRNLWIFVIR
jgi:hypothetical protein